MPKPRSGESHKDFIGRCMGDAEAVRDFPTREQRFAFCNSVFKRAHQAASPSFVLSMAAVQSGAAARTDQLMGRAFLVVPAVLVQDQVLHNNLGICFLPADEITDAWAAAWNNVPVIIHEHPTLRGVPVSARSPEILAARGVGYVFGAHVARNGSVKLKGEVWLDLARAEEIKELALILDRLRKGETVELSTGFSATVDETAGVHDGRIYEKVIHPQDADHLAIFAEGIGACSLADGCGLGVNATAENQTLHSTKEGVLVEHTANEEQQVLGIVDRLLRLIHKKEPEPAPDTPGAVAPACPQAAAANTVTHPLLKRLVGLGLTPCQARVAVGWARADNADFPESDEELRAKLYAALQKQYGGGPEKGVWVEAVFSGEKRVVFCVVQDKVVGGRVEQYFSSNYTMEEAGGITFATPAEVQRRVVYEAVKSTTATATQVEGTTMEEGKQNVEGGAAAQAATAPAVPAPVVAAPAPAAVPAPAALVENAEVTALQQTVADLSKKIGTLESLAAPAIAERERTRQTLITELAANEAVPFDKAELEAKPLEELQKLQQMSRGGQFAGRGGPRVTAAQSAEPQFMEPVPYFADPAAPAKTPQGKKEEQ